MNVGSWFMVQADHALFVVQVLVAIVGVYQLVLAGFGLRRRRRGVDHAPQKSFAVLVAAHNESKVVGALIDNLKLLDYPKELYDIYVICDNCTDNTAQIVKHHGAIACERFNQKQRGKGYAIEWMLKKLWKMPRAYDAVVMFDADNLVAADFLQHMNRDLCNGEKVIQAYLDTKNPHDSWVTAANAVTYWFCNRFWQLPRYNLRLANYLGGTGMCFDASLLKEMGWGATSLVEDLEFSVRCIQRGIKPVLNYDAKVYDEKPLTFGASIHQRLRWVRGQFDVARRYMLPMLWSGVKELNWVKIDATAYIFNVYQAFIGFVFGVALWVEYLFPNPPIHSLYVGMPQWLVLGYTALIFLQVPVAMILEKAPWRIFRSLLMFPVFFASWWPITVYAFVTQDNKQWSHTQHTRVLSLEDINGQHSLSS